MSVTLRRARPRVHVVALGLVLLAIAVPGWRPAFAAETPSVQIWPLGDSITQGITESSTRGGYRSPLDGQLGADGVAHLFVGTRTNNASPELIAAGQTHHDGHSGYRIDEVDRNLDGIAGGFSDNGGYWLTGTDTRPALYPDAVVIHLGTNDISQRYDPGVVYPTGNGKVNFKDVTQRRQFIAHMSVRLGTLIENIYELRPQVRVVLASIAPMDSGDFLPVSREYRVGVLRVVEYEQGLNRPVVFADVYRSFFHRAGGQLVLTPGYLGQDGIHPATAGYGAMASVISPAVSAVLGLPAAAAAA